MKILILTCKFGMGHYSAAKSMQDKIVKNYANIKIGNVDLKDYYMRTPKKFIKDFLNEIKNFAFNIDNYQEEEFIESEYSLDEENEVKVVDLFELAYPEFIDIFYKLFSIAIEKGAKIYNFIYKREYVPASEQKFLEIIYSHILGSVGKLLTKEKPSIVISSFSICSEIISDYKKFSGSNIPLITSITDITPHQSWINENTDFYTVASQETKKALIENGVEQEKIYITGMPVSEKFEKLKNTPKTSPNKEKKLLIMGGGLGLIPKDLGFYEKLNSIQNLKTTVITAKNKRAYNKLYKKFDNIRVLGYCNNVNEEMLDADLLLSKSGGITTFESIYTKLPIAVFKPFLIQEMSNAEFIKNNEIGIVLESKIKNVINDVDDIVNLIFDENRLQTMKNNMENILATIDEKAMLNLLDSINKEQNNENLKGSTIKIKKVSFN